MPNTVSTFLPNLKPAFQTREVLKRLKRTKTLQKHVAHGQSNALSPSPDSERARVF